VKITFLTLLCLVLLNVYSQLPYSWTSNVDPGWTSINVGSGGSLQWRSGCNAVTTNCSGNYSNNQNTTYTSPTIDAGCVNASTLAIQFFISGNGESNYDFLFMEYSLNGGTTWINPYGVGVGLSGNAGAGLIWTLPTIPTSNTFRFRFRFTSDPSVRASGYRITNFQILCNVVLPIELLSFTGKNLNNCNYIEWSTASEINNDYFTLEKSTDWENWKTINSQSGQLNTTKTHFYNYIDSNYSDTLNYYRLSQTDFDGSKEYFNVIVINNESKPIKTIDYYDLLGIKQTHLKCNVIYIKRITYIDNTVKQSKFTVSN